MYCKNCGTLLEENAQFCGYCGSKVEQEPSFPVNPEPIFPVNQTPNYPVNPEPSFPVNQVPNYPVNPEPMFQPSPAPQQPTKKKNSGIIYVIIAIVVVLLIAVVAVVGIGSSKKDNTPDYKPNSGEEITNPPVENPDGVIENPTEDTNSDETYTNINTAYMSLVSSLYTEGDMYYQYMIYDMDQDGITEFLYMKGTCRADLKIYCYTFDGAKIQPLGVTYGDDVYRTEENTGLYTFYAQMGGETLRLVTKSNNTITTQTVFSREVDEYTPPADEYVLEKFNYNDYTGINTYAHYSQNHTPTPQAKKEMYVFADGGLRLRSTPGIEDGNMLELIPDGTKVTIERTLGEWVYTTYNGKAGWCSREFLFEKNENLGTVLFSATVNSNGGIKLRSKPDTSVENTIMVVPNGAQVQVYEVNGSWARISYNGISGWCYTEYLSY
ncbi:MAG: SH3 domain-containing protein [Clostridia bacterium]|nr:SH3 domain-containing protein [Clostridia bacterium]